MELAEGIRRRDHTATEALESVLSRVDDRNPHLNAITYDCRDAARAEAAAADEGVAAGVELGPLHGVPVTIKENVDQAGTPNPNGFVPAFADLIASTDAPLVSNLRKAGAVIFGRTNTPEFSMRATTDNPLRGRTRNPWDDEASPGGFVGWSRLGVCCGVGPAASRQRHRRLASLPVVRQRHHDREAEQLPRAGLQRHCNRRAAAALRHDVVSGHHRSHCG